MSTKTLLIVAIVVVAFLLFRQTGAAASAQATGTEVSAGTSTFPGLTATAQPGTQTQATAAWALAQQGMNMGFAPETMLFNDGPGYL